MNLELSDTEAEALAQELSGTINYARYPLSSRIQALRAILQKLAPEPEREPLAPRKIYELRRRGGGGGEVRRWREHCAAAGSASLS